MQRFSQKNKERFLPFLNILLQFDKRPLQRGRDGAVLVELPLRHTAVEQSRVWQVEIHFTLLFFLPLNTLKPLRGTLNTLKSEPVLSENLL